MAINAVLREVVKRNWKPAVIFSTMVRMLNFDAVEYASTREAKGTVCRRFQHADRPPCKLLGYLGSPFLTAHWCASSKAEGRQGGPWRRPKAERPPTPA
jgi:hypothetical protein